MLYLPRFSFHQRMWPRYSESGGFKRLLGRSADPTFLQVCASLIYKKMQKCWVFSENKKKPPPPQIRTLSVLPFFVSWATVRMHTHTSSRTSKIFRAKFPTVSKSTLSLPAACLLACLQDDASSSTLPSLRQISSTKEDLAICKTHIKIMKGKKKNAHHVQWLTDWPTDCPLEQKI